MPSNPVLPPSALANNHDSPVLDQLQSSSLPSYIASLPPELLCRIFSFATGDQNPSHTSSRRLHPYRPISPGEIPFQLVASQVSTYWRDVITSYESFSTLDIYSDEFLDLISHALRGSSTHLINVNIDIYDWEGNRHHPPLLCPQPSAPGFTPALAPSSLLHSIPSSPDTATSSSPVPPAPLTRLGRFKEAVSRLIVRHAHRWKSFTLFTYQEETGYDILSRLEGCHVPALETIRINCEVAFPAGTPEWKERCFFDGESPLTRKAHAIAPGAKTTAQLDNEAPKLTRLLIESIFSWPPLANLTTLHLQRPSSRPLLPPFRVINLLQQAPLLETLQLHHYLDFIPWPVNTTPTVTLSHLKVLSLIETGMGVAKFLLTIWAPELESLWVECSYADGLELMLNYRQRPQQPGSITGLSIPPALLKLGSTLPRRPAPHNTEDREEPSTLRSLHFPKLRYLTLQSFSILRLGIFADVIPTITSLHLSYCPIWSLPFIHNVFQSPATASTDPPSPTLLNSNPHQRRRWPNLETVVFRTTRDIYPISEPLLTALLSFVQERKQDGFPLKQMLADDGFLKSLLSGKGATLQNHVDVVELSEETYDEPGWCLRERGLF